jgi:hypothetical protein
MPQTGQSALAASDVSDNGWTPSPVTPQINVSPADTNWVTSQSDFQGNNFQVKLQGLAWPTDGPQSLTVRLRSGGGNNPVSIVLLDGTNGIASMTVTPTTTFQPYTLVLTTAQKQAIADYSNLRVQVGTANQVSCCPNNLPFSLAATVSNVVACDCLNNHVVPLTWSTAQQAWTGSDNTINCSSCAPNCNLILTLTCTAQNRWQLSVKCSQSFQAMTVFADTGGTCSPFHQTFTFGPVFGPISNCCTGTAMNAAEFKVTVTS